MKFKRRVLFIAIILLLQSFAGMYLAANADESMVEQRLSIERSIQEKTERLVEKIIGSKDIVVLATVELEREQMKQSEKPSFPGALSSQEEYLPGVNYSYMPMNLGNASSNLSINKINLLVTIDMKVPEPLVARVKKETAMLLKLNLMRGDAVEVEKIVFAKKSVPVREILMGFVPLIFLVAGFVMLILFLFGPVSHFFKTIVKAMEIRIEADTRIKGLDGMFGGGGKGMGNVASLAAPGSAGPSRTEGTGTAAGRTKKFGYVDEGNIKNLLFLLKTEEPEKIAIVTNYMPSIYASSIMNSLSPTLQSQVALALTKPKVIDPQEVDNIEKDLKVKLDYMVGGEEYFLNLLDEVDMESQGNILKSLDSTNRAMADKLRKLLFFFEDIVILDKTVLQKVIRETQRSGISLALALKNASDEIKLKIMNALSEGARAMLAEQIDLLGETSEKRIIDEQKAIARIVKNLEKSGEIVIDRSKSFKIIEEKEKVFEPEEVPKAAKETL